MNILSLMEKKFIEQAHDIVLNNLTDEKFGVQKLASLLNLSTTHTLRKIRAATGKSVNQYIRELRLKKAAKLIKKTELTIAEIAYKVGFGSPSYFNNTFSRYYGITPGEYKTQSKSLSELKSEKIKKRTRSITYWKKAFYFITVLMIVGIGYLLINNSLSSEIKPIPNSIAVLPFRDMSPEDSQWFSDGVSDNILTYLSQIKDLTVISFTSSSTFRETDKTIPEIAKELGVSYILEGSVTVFEDKIKINAQLINANDDHIWSQDYNENFNNVIAIQQNIAREISEKLEITLSPEEAIVLEKYPTENMEAYSLHLKGRLFNDSRKLEDLKLNIELNKQAIALDSNFADAYAEVSFSYYLLTDYYPNTIDPFEVREKALYYANKALQNDPNNCIALETKGSLFDYVDWGKAIEYSKKNVELNPNDAQSHKNYAFYFRYSPNQDFISSLEQYKIAYKLDPLSSVIGSNLFIVLLRLNKINEAEELYKKIKFHYSGYLREYQSGILTAHKNKDWTSIIPIREALIKEHPDNDIYFYFLAWDYAEIMNDYQKAIYYAEITSISPSPSKSAE